MDNIGIIILVIVFVIIFIAYKKRKENEFLENVSYIRENFKHDSLNDSLNSIEDLENKHKNHLIPEILNQLNVEKFLVLLLINTRYIQFDYF